MNDYGYLVEYWPGTKNVKSFTYGYWDKDIPEGYGFLAEGQLLPDPVDPPPTQEQLLGYALAERDQRLTISAIRIAPLQDAADLDDSTPAEAALLKKWKQYRVAVNRVSDQTDYPLSINWPTEPS